jgi:hypothetical protein
MRTNFKIAIFAAVALFSVGLMIHPPVTVSSAMTQGPHSTAAAYLYPGKGNGNIGCSDGSYDCTWDDGNIGDCIICDATPSGHFWTFWGFVTLDSYGDSQQYAQYWFNMFDSNTQGIDWSTVTTTCQATVFYWMSSSAGSNGCSLSGYIGGYMSIVPQIINYDPDGQYYEIAYGSWYQ